ncbi:MAG TPA: acyltransferase family protein [Caulobacteraceae bacterium]|nr:acyltransferase family protein [Caulobacteraceae bacterium]
MNRIVQIDAAPGSTRSLEIQRPRYRPEIDGLRALSVFIVILFHAAHRLLPGGFIGVDVFFVISGFLITGIILTDIDRGEFEFTRFYGRRIRRIYPALIFVLSCCLAWGWFLWSADIYSQLGKSVFGGAYFIANFIQSKSSGYFENSSQTNPMLHLWSLGVEEQFYIFWPVILVGLRKYGLNVRTALISIILFSLGLALLDNRRDPVMTFYAPQTRFWELAMGALLAWSGLDRPDWQRRSLTWLDRRLATILWERPGPAVGLTLAGASGLAGLVLVGLGVSLTRPSSLFPGWLTLLPALGATLIIAAGSKSRTNRWLLANPAAVWFGRLSYPLYLWHWPILAIFRLETGVEPQGWSVVGLLALALILGETTYYLIEKPLRRARNDGLKTLVLAMAMIAVGAFGLSIHRFDGLQFRPPIREQTGLARDLSSIVDLYKFFDVDPTWRKNTCFSPAVDVGFQQKLDACVDPERPLIFVMGDSHAAMLCPGLKSLQAGSDRAFGIAQFTNADGPPFSTTIGFPAIGRTTIAPWPT